MSAWTLCFQPRPAASVRLFCLGFAGGAASAFRLWGSGLPEAIEVRPVQLPGRESRFSEAPFTSLETLVPALAAALRPELDRPFALYGHSMGALVAFELVRHLRRSGGPMPDHLVVGANKAPHRPNLPAIHHLPDDAFLDGVRAYGGLPEAVFADPELRVIFTRLLRADFALLDSHRYAEEPALALPITAIAGDQDPKYGPEDLAMWEREAGATFSQATVAGGHFFLQDNRQALLSVIADRLVAPAIPPGEPPAANPTKPG